MSSNLLGGSVAEFVDEHCSGTLCCSIRDSWRCDTAFCMFPDLSVHLWHHGASSLSYAAEVPFCLCAFGLMLDVDCASGVLGLCWSVELTQPNTVGRLLRPQGAAGVLHCMWNVTITCATPSVLSGGTLGVCASIFLSLSSVFLSLNELYDSGVRPDRIQDRAGSCRVAQTSMVTSKLRLAHR